MKITYEVCDVCRERLPNNGLKRKLKKWHNMLMLSVYETNFWGAKLEADEKELLLCGKCWDTFIETWKKIRREKDARK